MPPANFHVQSTTDTTVTLKWTPFDTSQLSHPSNFKRYVITGQVNENQAPKTNYIIVAGETTAEIPDLVADSNYTFSIFAQSEGQNPANKQTIISDSNSSAPVIAKTKEEGKMLK